MQLDLLKIPPAAPVAPPRPKNGKCYLPTLGEFRVLSLRESPLNGDTVCDEPSKVADYYRSFIVHHPYFNSEQENMFVLCMNCRRRVYGHTLCAQGTKDTLLVHPAEVLRPAVIVNAAAIVLLHNHPSGDSSPSEADIKVTRDLIRAGQLMKIDVLDHIIMGAPQAVGNVKGYVSLRELGYFYS